jgi:predicted ABC-type ATPase
MILIAGINGAGKTSFYYNRLKPLLEEQGFEFPFINADEIEKANHPTEVGQHGTIFSGTAMLRRS